MSEIQPTEFLVASLSEPAPLLAIGSIPAHQRYVRDVGADGLELTPTHVSRFMRQLLYRADILEDDPTDWTDTDEALKGLVRAQHVSFRNDIGDDGLVARAFPNWRTSLEQMAQIQRITGPLGAVLYPGFEGGRVRYSDQNAPFSERLFMPNATDWGRMGLREDSSIDEIEDALDERGFTAIAFDLFQCQKMKDKDEDEGARFEDPLTLAERLAAAGLIRVVRLSVNRLDLAGLRSPIARSTRQAGRAFTHSSTEASRTLEGKMLLAIVSGIRQNPHGSNGEPNALKQVVLADGPIRPPRSSRRRHAAMIKHARELVAG